MKQVCVYEKDGETLEFLRKFFSGHKEYRPVYAKSPVEFKKHVKKGIDALVIGAPGMLDKVKADEISCPMIAMVSSEITAGLRSVVRYDVESYMIYPFYKADLDYKLRTVCNKKGWLKNLYTDHKELEAVTELTYLMTASLEPKEVLYFIVKKMSEIIDVSRCSILSVGFRGDKARVISTFENPKLRDIEIELVKYPEVRQALNRKKTVVVKDALKDPLMKEVRDKIAKIGVRSIIVAPVVFRDEVIGSLFLRTTSSGHVFSAREVKLCNSIANASANALYNAFLFEKVISEKEKLQKLAITDFLTGVFNVRYLYHRLDEEFSRAVRYGTPISCIIMDIDHFKKINDTYGHRAGDLALREFAQLIKKHTRKSDIFARYGGEEFITILPETDSEGALSKCGDIAEIINKHKYENLDGKSFTVSMGIATSPHKNIKTQDDLIRYADTALYAAKKQGRNKAVAYK